MKGNELSRQIQNNLDILLSTRRYGLKKPTLGEYKLCISNLLPSIKGDFDLNTLAIKLKNLVESVNPGPLLEASKWEEPIEVTLPSCYRHTLNFPVSIIKDVIFGKIILKLGSTDDFALLLSTIRGYLFDCMSRELASRFLGEEAVCMLEGEASGTQIVLKSKVFKYFYNFYLYKNRAGWIAWIRAFIKACTILEDISKFALKIDEKSLGYHTGYFTLLLRNLSGTATTLPRFLYPPYTVLIDLVRKTGNLKQRVLNRITFFAERTAENIGSTIRSFTENSIKFSKSVLAGMFNVIFSIDGKPLIQILLILLILQMFAGRPNPGFSGMKKLTSLDKTEIDRDIEQTTYRVTDRESAEPEIEDKVALAKSPDKEETPPQPVKKYSEGAGEANMQWIYYFEDKKLDFENKLHFTFDDGPNLNIITTEINGNKVPENTVTGYILDALKERNIKATFFLLGKNLIDSEGRPLPGVKHLLHRIIEEGHTIGNHSFNHHNLAQGIYNDGENDIEEIKEEIEATQHALDKVLGFHYPIRYFRPPYAEGGRNKKVDQAVRELGMAMILFQIDSFDYRANEDNSLNRESIIRDLEKAITRSRGGAILMHDREITAHILPELFSSLDVIENERGGFTMVNLYELMEIKYNRKLVDAGEQVNEAERSNVKPF